jgi:HAD superfamily hydrolase (TIGR01509 family)
MALAALIWDVDGTLAETEMAHLEAFNRAFRDAGMPWRWSADEYGGLLCVAGGRERILAYMARSRPPLPPGEEPEELAARLHRAKNEHYRAILGRGGLTRSDLTQGGLALRPGVSRLLREAKAQGLRQAVCTTSGRGNVLPLLDALVPGGSGFFDCIVTGDDAPRKKPDPQAYQAVLNLLGLDPRQCLAVEDSENGVAAATSTGIPVVAVPGVFTRADDFGQALAVLDSLGDPGAPAPCREGLVDVGVLRRWHTASLKIV